MNLSNKAAVFILLGQSNAVGHKVPMETNHSDYVAIFTLAMYAGLRLEECFRIDTNEAEKAIQSGKLFVNGKSRSYKIFAD